MTASRSTRSVRRRPLLFALTAFAAFAVCLPASAATRRANPGTNTLQGVINQSSNGDTILVNPGSYTVTRTINVNKDLTIRAADGNNRPNFFNGGGLGDFNSLMRVESGGSGATIRNLNFTRCERGAGVNVRQASNVRLEGLFVKDCGSSGILIEQSGNVVVTGSTLQNNVLRNRRDYRFFIPDWRNNFLWAAALSALDCDDIGFLNNTIVRNYGEGILLQGVLGATATGNFCSDNLSVNLYLNWCRNGYVANNTCTGNFDGRYYTAGRPAYGIGITNEKLTPYDGKSSGNLLLENNSVSNTEFGFWSPKASFNRNDIPVFSSSIKNNRFSNIYGAWYKNDFGIQIIGGSSF